MTQKKKSTNPKKSKGKVDKSQSHQNKQMPTTYKKKPEPRQNGVGGGEGRDGERREGGRKANG